METETEKPKIRNIRISAETHKMLLIKKLKEDWKSADALIKHLVEGDKL